jgi:hypothetical protein
MSLNTTNPALGIAAALTGFLGAGVGGAAARLGVRTPRPSDDGASDPRPGVRLRYMARMRPHATPMVIAICRAPDGSGRRYHQCITRDQAMKHGPYLIEHVNGWGQVTKRERFA